MRSRNFDFQILKLLYFRYTVKLTGELEGLLVGFIFVGATLTLGDVGGDVGESVGAFVSSFNAGQNSGMAPST